MENKTKINWYDLRDRQYLYLKKGILKKLIEEGIKEVGGSTSKLQKQLNSSVPYDIYKKDMKGISIKKLKQLLTYINKEYDSINNEILEIRRGKNSIKNPKFPINLFNKKIGSIMGNLVSDGWLSYDKSRKNYIRTTYCSGDEQAINMFTQNIKDIFGEVHFNQGYLRNSTVIRSGNSILGETLRRVGGTVGKKYKLNRGIPWIVKKGNKEIKKSYLSSIFDDEGSVGKNGFPYVILSRNVHIQLNNKEKYTINRFVVPLMKSNLFPTGHVTRRISIRLLKQILKEKKEYKILRKILNSKPKILIDESNLLKTEFDINNYTYVISLQLTSNNNYSVQSCMVIRNKKEIIDFYKNIGFNLSRKQNKLKNILIEHGGKIGVEFV